MTVVLRGHLLLAPASIAARAVATMLGLVLVRLTHQTARARALRTLALAVSHADKWLHKIGTVDKFQGQEAAACFFSMATSSGEEIPRNLEFLFSRNRLNVAVSRARCLGVLVCNPALLEIRCRSAEQMRLLNALCLFVEMGMVVQA
jgi:AAA domain